MSSKFQKMFSIIRNMKCSPILDRQVRNETKRNQANRIINDRAISKGIRKNVVLEKVLIQFILESIMMMVIFFQIFRLVNFWEWVPLSSLRSLSLYIKYQNWSKHLMCMFYKPKNKNASVFIFLDGNRCIYYPCAGCAFL